MLTLTMTNNSESNDYDEQTLNEKKSFIFLFATPRPIELGLDDNSATFPFRLLLGN